jgi:molybdate-binding protein/DNA-binding XRE family transcriptional regulator
MTEPTLTSCLRRRRSTAGLSQSELAARVGVSRQAIVAIEAGRQVPSTVLALQLANALGCSVGDLFQLAGGPIARARLADSSGDSKRVLVGRVDGDLVAHRLSGASRAADGLLLERSPSGDDWLVELLADPAEVDANLLVAGCAPLLGALSERLGRRYRDARATWIPADSGRALDLLARGLVHVAGVHLADAMDPNAHVRAAQTAFPGQRTTVVNLARWRQGFVVARGNPLHLGPGPELLRDDVRHVLRERGSGARRVLDRVLADASTSDLPSIKTSLTAADHAEVARLVRQGVADVGVAIEAVAFGEGLEFIPVSEECFDLIVPESRLEATAVSRFFDLIDRAPFRSEAEVLPGYDLSQAGHASTVEACVTP